MDDGAHPVGAPANDAFLVQLVRGALGRHPRGRPRINVSSCSFVVTLHGTVSSARERDGIGAVVRTVPGVRGAVSEQAFRGIWTLETYSAKMEVS